MHGADPPSRLSLAELLADLSLVTDLGMGNEPETAARTCLLATGLARGVGLTEEVVADVFYQGRRLISRRIRSSDSGRRETSMP